MIILCLVVCLILSVFFLILCLIPFFQRLLHSESISEFRFSSLLLFCLYLLLSVLLATKIFGGDVVDKKYIASNHIMVHDHMGGDK